MAASSASSGCGFSGIHGAAHHSGAAVEAGGGVGAASEPNASQSALRSQGANGPPRMSVAARRGPAAVRPAVLAPTAGGSRQPKTIAPPSTPSSGHSSGAVSSVGSGDPERSGSGFGS